MKIKIRITKETLYKSSNCNMDNQKTNCAIAVAIRDLWPFALVWGRGISGITPRTDKPTGIECPMFGYDIHFDSNITSWIQEFDASTPEERLALPEFSFEIDVPNSVIEKIGIGEVYKVLSESKTLELVQP